MREEVDAADEGTRVTIPAKWNDEVDVEEAGEGVYVVRRLDDGMPSPVAIVASDRPILVDVHFGRSAVVRSPVEAVRYGYRESDVRTEFYFLDMLDEPRWVRITEETDEDDLGIYQNVDRWQDCGELTVDEAEWAKAQFE